MNDINGFLANNRSFCDHPKESLNQFEDRNNINMEIELGAGLNSSFDAYMQNNMNNYNNNSSHNNLMMNMMNKPSYGTSNKKFGNGRYNQVAHAPVSNINYNKNCSNNFYKNNNMKDNNNINRSYGYINTNNFNEQNNSSVYNNSNNPNNSKYNNNSNYNTKTNISNKKINHSMDYKKNNL